MIQILLINFTWDVELSDSPKPFLMMQDAKGELTKKYLSLGDVLSGKFNEKRSCIGYEESKGNYVPCPSFNLPQEGFHRCYSCARHDFFTCRTYCNGKQCLPSSLRAKEMCTPPDTAVYLTAVGDVVKVGVSLNPVKRWLDQGSLFGVVLYQAPGLEARKIENELSKFLGITKTVTFTSKLRSLPSLDLKKARLKLEKMIKKTEKYQGFREYRTDDFQVWDLTPHYGEFMTIHHLPQEIKVNQEFSGRIAGFLGKIILLENHKTYFALNLKKFVGHWGIIGSELKRIKGQLSLNSFFG